MKRLRILLVILLSFILTGCIREYNYTQEQTDEMAEYMAGVLLKSDPSYKEELMPEEVNASGDQNESSSSAAAGTDSQAAPSVADSSSAALADSPSDTKTQQNCDTLSEVIGNTNFNIEYDGYRLARTYPDDPSSESFSLTPRDGYQLLIVSFKVENKANSKKELNLIEDDIKYQLDINSAISYKPLLTFLENNLQYIDITINGKQKKEVFLLFEISKDTEMSNINLAVSKGNKTTVIEFK